MLIRRRQRHPGKVRWVTVEGRKAELAVGVLPFYQLTFTEEEMRLGEYVSLPNEKGTLERYKVVSIPLSRWVYIVEKVTKC